MPDTDRFAKYGLTVDGCSFWGPKRPPRTFQTPAFTYSDPRPGLLADTRAEVIRLMTEPLSGYADREAIMRLIGTIFRSLTGEPLEDFAHIRILTHEDFAEFRRLAATHSNMANLGEYNGINCQGLVLVEESESNALFPLILHELGHTLYPETGDRYLDEFRAYYFEVLATEHLETAMGHLGRLCVYPRERDDYPSPEHRQAHLDARQLRAFEMTYDYLVNGDARREAIYQRLRPLAVG